MKETLRKQVEPDDPMELVGVACEGDPGFMIECIVEEYARMGWPSARIVRLFESPSYPLLHGFLKTMGADAVRRKIEETTSRCGVFQVRTMERLPAEALVEIQPAGKGDGKDE